jgi:transposase
LYAKVEPQDREAICSEMKSATDAKWYRRLKVIDLSGQGYSVPDLSRLLDLSEATIRSYIHHFNRTGIAGLRPGYGRGRPPLLALSQDEWLDVLAQSPADLPLLETKAHNWTQARLRQYLKLYHQIEVSQSTIAKSLRSAGIHWRRAKLRVHSPDPLYQVKRQRIAQLQQLALEGELTCVKRGIECRQIRELKCPLIIGMNVRCLHYAFDAIGTSSSLSARGFGWPNKPARRFSLSR